MVIVELLSLNNNINNLSTLKGNVLVVPTTSDLIDVNLALNFIKNKN